VLRAAGRRLGYLLLIVLSAALLAAALMRLAPGFGMDERQLDSRLSAGSLEAIQAERAREANLPRYFWNYLAGLCRGDLGSSISLGRPVRELIGERAGLTLGTLAFGLAVAWLAGVAAVFCLELLRRPWCDVTATALSGTVLCVPAAVLALFCLYAGATAAAAIGAILLPRIFRYARNVIGAASQRAHVLAARARGVPRISILVRHVWLPAMPELIALAGVSVSMAIGAAIPVEALCDSPGVGQLVWQAALARDLPVLVNVTILVAALTAAANLVADIGRAACRAGG